MRAIICPVPSPLTVPEPVEKVIESSPYAAGQLRRRQAREQATVIELVHHRPERTTASYRHRKLPKDVHRGCKEKRRTAERCENNRSVPLPLGEGRGEGPFTSRQDSGAINASLHGPLQSPQFYTTGQGCRRILRFCIIEPGKSGRATSCLFVGEPISATSRLFMLARLTAIPVSIVWNL